MIKPEADRPRVEPAHERRVLFQLHAVAIPLAVEKPFAVRALVRSRLEVDDPAHAVGDEAAIERHVHDDAVVHAGERPFALRLGVRRFE